MDLSKEFSTINYDPLLVKLHAYGVSTNALKLGMSCLQNRNQRIKVDNYYSSWEKLLTCMQKCSVLGPILFNIYLNDLFYVVKNSDICNFADNIISYSSGFNFKQVMKNVENDCSILVES